MSWWLDISDLDDDQKDVIELPPNGKYLIVGPPGSGKTNLLLIRAEYLIRTDMPNLFVLMFNEPLHDFVVRGGVHYQVPASKIKKMLSWEIVLLRENGIPFEDLPEDDLHERRRALACKVLQLITDNPNLRGHLECLLVDEVQDCLNEEIDVFFACAKHVCFAGDNAQRIFHNEDILPRLQASMDTVQLRTHYRIGHEICRAADAVGATAGIPPILPTCNYKESESRVHFHNCASIEEQISKLIENLSVQITAFPGEILGVAAPRKVDRDLIRQKIEESALAPLLLPHRQAGSEISVQRIYVANVSEIKGLEFRTIHLALMENISKMGENQKRLTYTAITRAKTTVSIYYTLRIPGYLEQARVAVEPPQPRPPLADLFPNKRKEF